MKKKILLTYILTIIGVGILQFIAAMLVTLLVSVMFPSLEKAIENNIPLFVVVLGLSYAIGIWLVGWLFIVMKWRKVPSDFGLRFVTTIIGTYLSIIIALMAYPKLEPGNPFLFIAMITGIIGFLVPEWLTQGESTYEPPE